MVVGEESLALVVAACILSVEAPLQIALKLVVIGAFLVHLAQTGIVEGFGVVGQHFGVISEGETRVPLLGKLDVRLGKRSNKLIVQV